MFSSKRNIQQLVSLMYQHGITEIVICPGSRNMPLAESFSSCQWFKCHAITDERSAGFFAIGLSISRNRPVAVCVTSGSALLNLTSAVSEAFYQRIPLLIISADRPQAWIGQMDGQTLPQLGVFASLIKKEVSLPEPQNTTDEWYCNRLINEAILELCHHTNGPVHINIPISEPFFSCNVQTIPEERIIKRGFVDANIWKKSKRPLFIIGQLTKKEAIEVKELLIALNCPIICEHLSNLGYHKHFIYNAEQVISTWGNELAPDLIVYLGGHIVSKKIKNWLREKKVKNCWRVDKLGNCADTFQSLSLVIEEDNISFLKILPPKQDTTFFNQWIFSSKEKEKNTESVNLPYSALSIVKDLLKKIPEHSALILANSSVVRYAQMFPLKNKDCIVSCNRGINGIDGSLSSAVGFASANVDRTTFLLIGDLSFFYDLTGLWNTQLPPNLRIILINNGCGEIFRTLPSLNINKNTEKYVLAHHVTSAKGWVETIHANYISAKNEESASQCFNLLLTNKQLTVAEFFTDPIEDVNILKQINNNNSNNQQNGK